MGCEADIQSRPPEHRSSNEAAGESSRSLASQVHDEMRQDCQRQENFEGSLAGAGFKKTGDLSTDVANVYQMTAQGGYDLRKPELGPLQSTNYASMMLKAAGVDVRQTPNTQDLIKQLESEKLGWTRVPAAEAKPGYLAATLNPSGPSRVGVVANDGHIISYNRASEKMHPYESGKFANEHTIYLKPPSR